MQVSRRQPSINQSFDECSQTISTTGCSDGRKISTANFGWITSSPRTTAAAAPVRLAGDSNETTDKVPLRPIGPEVPLTNRWVKMTAVNQEPLTADVFKEQGQGRHVEQVKSEAYLGKEVRGGEGDNGSRKDRVNNGVLINVNVIKKPSTGVGFSIEGGKGSLNGDRPIIVRKLFSGKY